MLSTNPKACKRLYRRLTYLVAFAVFSFFLHLRFEMSGNYLLYIAVIAIWFVYIIYEIDNGLKGFWKSGRESSEVSIAELLQEDPSTRQFLIVYIALIMLIFYQTLDTDYGREQLVSPGGIFISLVPLATVIIWRLYRLETIREAT